MRRLLGLIILLFLLFVPVVPQVHSSSQQAYQDYQFQYDLYRQRLTDFNVARTEFKKFRSLTSEATALEKSKLLLAQRNSAIRAYLVFLHERLAENPGLLSSERSLYRTIIGNEIVFLDNQSALVPQIASLADAERISDQLTSHYEVLQAATRQTIVAIQLGFLTYFAGKLDTSVQQAQAIITANRTTLPPTKLATLDRWLLSVVNKHSLYQQKVASVRQAAFKLKGRLDEQERTFNQIQSEISTAKLYLTEGTSFLKEIVSVLSYAD